MWLLGLLLLGPVTCDPQLLRSTVTYGGVGQAVTFTIPGAAPLKDILWKKGKNKVIEWDEASLPKPRAFPPFLDRAALNTTSGDLTIHNLESSDEGDYEVEYNSIKGDTKFQLLVLEPPPSLTVNCIVTGENVTVRCGLSQSNHRHAELLKFSWLCPAATCRAATSSQELHFKRDELPGEITCVVKNPLSQSRSSTGSSGCPAPGNQSRHHWVLLIPILMFLILFIVGYILKKKRLKESGQLDKN